MEKGSCQRGEKRCRFSHKITDEQRNNDVFVENHIKEKDEKASKCLNEFRARNSCRNGNKCPFSHKISDDDRDNNDMRRKMEERCEAMKKRKELQNKQPVAVAAHDSNEWVKEMTALRLEFAEMKKEMLKMGRGP